MTRKPGARLFHGSYEHNEAEIMSRGLAPGRAAVTHEADPRYVYLAGTPEQAHGWAQGAWEDDQGWGRVHWPEATRGIVLDVDPRCLDPRNLRPDPIYGRLPPQEIHAWAYEGAIPPECLKVVDRWNVEGKPGGRPMTYRRNADEDLRQRERQASRGAQEALDRLVVAKLRAGKAGAITLYEMQQATPGLIPPEVAQRSLQDSFNALGQSASLDWHGGTLHLGAGDERDAPGEPVLVVNFDDGGLDPQFSVDAGGGVTHPRLRLFVGINWIDTWDDDVRWHG